LARINSLRLFSHGVHDLEPLHGTPKTPIHCHPSTNDTTQTHDVAPKDHLFSIAYLPIPSPQPSKSPAQTAAQYALEVVATRLHDQPHNWETTTPHASTTILPSLHSTGLLDACHDNPRDRTACLGWHEQSSSQPDSPNRQDGEYN